MIQLDQSTNFIYAYTAPGGNQDFAYHEANFGNFECTLYADGTVCGQQPSPPPIPDPIPAAPEGTTITMSNGSSLAIEWDTANNRVQFWATVMENSFLGLGFGQTMTDTEMIVWSANGNQSYVNTYYSTGNKQPDVLTYDPACYDNQFNFLLSGTYVKFYSTRSLECTPDNPKHPTGYLIQLNQDTDFIYSFSPPGGDY